MSAVEAITSGSLTRIRLPPKSAEDEGSGDKPSEMTVEKWAELWEQQNMYIDQLEAKYQSDSMVLKDLEQKSKVSSQDATKKEHFLVMRLSAKEQEIQELMNQIAELKSAQAPSTASLRNTLLDPAVNLIIQRLKRELESNKTKMQETQEELSSWKFTPDSHTGKRLMSKCRQLLQENEDIGKMISSGRLAKLETELAMQKNLCGEMKKNQVEMDEFVQELDEDVEGMQSTILLLQTQLKEAKEKIAALEAEVAALKAVKPEQNVEEGKKEVKQEVVEEPTKEDPEPMDEDKATPVKESAEEEEEEEVTPSRGRRGRGQRTPTKTESPGKRGARSTRGQRREADDEETKGRPKRRRNAPQRFEEEEGKKEEEEGI